MQKTVPAKILELLSESKELYVKEGVLLLGFFGSYAKNTYDKYSDVDIAYTLDHEKFSKTYKDGFSKILRLEEIKKTLEQRLHKNVDLVSLDSNNTTLIEQIKKEIIYV